MNEKKKIGLQVEAIETAIEGFQNADVFDLGGLMNEARFLSCQLYPFAREVGEMKRLYNEAHVTRRISFARLVQKYREAGETSITKAERAAELDPEWQEAFKREYELEARWKKGVAMLAAMHDVVTQQRQEIAEMRAEKQSQPFLEIVGELRNEVSRLRSERAGATK